MSQPELPVVDPVLESAAVALIQETSDPPFLYQLSPEEGRAIVNDLQANYPNLPAADIEDVVVPGGPTGSVPVRIVRPQGASGVLPVIIYTHGLGWVFGGPQTHDRLIRELAVGVGAAVVFPDYTLSPEAKYPTALEQVWTVAQWVVSEGAAHSLDAARLAVAGDSVGGNLTIALTLLAKQRGGVPIQQQVLFYPVTNAAFDTGSYQQFAEGFFLARAGMQWFWDQYTTSAEDRAQITASPLRATVEDLQGLPPALVIVAEADVLRDEGEAYAARLFEAGVPVERIRYLGIIHDFVGLNALRDTIAAEGAIAKAIATLRTALGA
jgi:acetyl esterase